ncbi:hypothetical protein TorRG33x02_321260 [Trema orientale]|uniref:Uncharacterized protein n=1 Tax=Trema orientale TaxID=63057 RepID=A0A2P5BH57_TREOI|nr:hypothetical protein TorRG33x02_321260 [Trema orientale]
MYSEFKMKNPKKNADKVRREMGVDFRQMSPIKKVQYGVLPYVTGTSISERVKPSIMGSQKTGQ